MWRENMRWVAVGILGGLASLGWGAIDDSIGAVAVDQSNPVFDVYFVGSTDGVGNDIWMGSRDSWNANNKGGLTVGSIDPYADDSIKQAVVAGLDYWTSTITNRLPANSAKIKVAVNFGSDADDSLAGIDGTALYMYTDWAKTYSFPKNNGFNVQTVIESLLRDQRKTFNSDNASNLSVYANSGCVEVIVSLNLGRIQTTATTAGRTLAEMVQATVVHEMGHAFGISSEVYETTILKGDGTDATMKGYIVDQSDMSRLDDHLYLKNSDGSLTKLIDLDTTVGKIVPVATAFNGQTLYVTNANAVASANANNNGHVVWDYDGQPGGELVTLSGYDGVFAEGSALEHLFILDSAGLQHDVMGTYTSAMAFSANDLELIRILGYSLANSTTPPEEPEQPTYSHTATVATDLDWSAILWTVAGGGTTTTLPQTATAQLTITGTPTISFDAGATVSFTSLAIAGSGARFSVKGMGTDSVTLLTTTLSGNLPTAVQPIILSGYTANATVNATGFAVSVTRDQEISVYPAIGDTLGEGLTHYYDFATNRYDTTAKTIAGLKWDAEANTLVSLPADEAFLFNSGSTVIGSCSTPKTNFLNAISGAGNQTRVYAKDMPFLNPATAETKALGWTIATWAMRAVSGSTSVYPILVQGELIAQADSTETNLAAVTASVTTGWGLYYASDTKKPVFRFATTTDGQTFRPGVIVGSTAITEGTAQTDWHHYVITCARTPSGDLLTLYLDGRAIGTSQVTSGSYFVCPANSFYLNNADGGQGQQNANDDLAIWNRALAATEVARLAGDNDPTTAEPLSTLASQTLVTYSGSAMYNQSWSDIWWTPSNSFSSSQTADLPTSAHVTLTCDNSPELAMSVTDTTVWASLTIQNEATFAVTGTLEGQTGDTFVKPLITAKISGTTPNVTLINVQVPGYTNVVASFVETGLVLTGTKIPEVIVPPEPPVTPEHSISVNFNSAQGSVTAAYGLVSAEHWNNLTGANGTNIALLNNAGEATRAKITFSSNNAYQWTGATDALLKGYLDDGGSGITISVTGIPYSSYKVIVYQATDTANYSFNPPSINGTWYTWDATTQQTKVGDTQSRNAQVNKYGTTQQLTAIEGSNVLVVDNATLGREAFSGTLNIVAGGNANSARGCIAGIQIVCTGELLATCDFTSSVATGTQAWSGLTWTPESFVSGALNRATLNFSGNTTLDLNQTITAESVTFAGTGAVTLNKSGDVTGVGTFDFKDLTGVTTVNFGTGSSPVLAGANTVLTQTGSGALTIAANKKATVPEWNSSQVSGAGTLVLNAATATTVINATTKNNNFTGTNIVTRGVWTFGQSCSSGTPNVYPVNSSVVVSGAEAKINFTVKDVTGWTNAKTLTLADGGTALFTKRDSFNGTINFVNGGRILSGEDDTNDGRSLDLLTTLRWYVSGTTPSVVGGAAATVDATTGDPIVESGILCIRKDATIDVAANTQLDIFSQWGSNKEADSVGKTLNKTGAGRLAFYRDAPVQTGKTTISAGTLALVNQGKVSSGEIAILANATLEVVTTNSYDKTIANLITGAGRLVKKGLGSLTLTTANTYTGETILEQGTLRVTNASALGTGALTFAAGTTLDLSALTTPLAATAVSLPSGAVATIVLGQRSLVAGETLMTWTTLPAGDFVCDDPRWILEKEATGLKCTRLTFVDTLNPTEETFIAEIFQDVAESTYPKQVEVKGFIQGPRAKALSASEAIEAVNLLGITPEVDGSTSAEKTTVTVRYEFGIVDVALGSDGAITLTVKVEVGSGCSLGEAVHGNIQVYAVNMETQVQTPIEGTRMASPRYSNLGTITLPAFTPESNQMVFVVKIVD